MFTRKDFMEKQCSYREYYAQYVTDRMKETVEQHIGIDKLLNSTDEHLNDIRLGVWDDVGFRCVGNHTKQQFVDNGDYVTPAGVVCLMKEAARQLIEEHSNEFNRV